MADTPNWDDLEEITPEQAGDAYQDQQQDQEEQPEQAPEQAQQPNWDDLEEINPQQAADIYQDQQQDQQAPQPEQPQEQAQQPNPLMKGLQTVGDIVNPLAKPARAIGQAVVDWYQKQPSWLEQAKQIQAKRDRTTLRPSDEEIEFGLGMVAPSELGGRVAGAGKGLVKVDNIGSGDPAVIEAMKGEQPNAGPAVKEGPSTPNNVANDNAGPQQPSGAPGAPQQGGVLGQGENPQMHPMNAPAANENAPAYVPRGGVDIGAGEPAEPIGQPAVPETGNFGEGENAGQNVNAEQPEQYGLGWPNKPKDTFETPSRNLQAAPEETQVERVQRKANINPDNLAAQGYVKRGNTWFPPEKAETPVRELPFAEEAEPLEGEHGEITPRGPLTEISEDEARAATQRDETPSHQLPFAEEAEPLEGGWKTQEAEDLGEQPRALGAAIPEEEGAKVDAAREKLADQATKEGAWPGSSNVPILREKLKRSGRGFEEAQKGGPENVEGAQAMARKKMGETKSPEEVLKAIEEDGTLERLEKAAGKEIPEKPIMPETANAKWGEVPTKARWGIERVFNRSPIGRLFVGEGTPAGEIASHDVRKHGRFYRVFDSIDHSLEDSEEVIGKLPPEAQREIRTFLDKTEPGAKISSMPELQGHIDAIRGAHADVDDLVDRYGTMDRKDFDRNWWPNQFKDPNAARDFLDEWTAEGKKGKLNTRKDKMPSLQEAIDEGHELKTDNPFTALRQRNAAQLAKLALNNIIQAGKDRELIQERKPNAPAPEDPTGKWVPLKAKGLNGQILYAPQGYASVFNRNYSPSFMENPLGKAIVGGAQRVGNWSTAFQLGLSPFHFSTMLQERAVNQVARALQGENPLATAKAIKDMFQGPGKKLLEEWTNRGSHPELSKFVDKLEDIGAKPLGRNPEEEFGIKSNTQAAKNALRVAPDMWKRAIRDLHNAKQDRMLATGADKPLLVTKQMMNGVSEAMHGVTEPLFGVVIPRMKVASFAENLGKWMDKNPGHTDAQATKAAHEIWKDIESRFGLMNHDNLWMDRRIKEVATAALTSMSWNYGFLRNAGLAGKDIILHPQRISMKSKDYNPNISSLIALGIVTAMTGTAIGLLKGQGLPSNMKNMFFPPSGGVDDKGRPIHIQSPGFQKDWLSYALHPFDEPRNKLKPVWQALWSLMDNQGWMDTEKGPRKGPIADLSKHSMADYLESHAGHFLKESMPISIKNLTEHHPKDSGLSNLERFFALKEAPKALFYPPSDYVDEKAHKDWLSSHGQSEAPKTVEEKKAAKEKKLKALPTDDEGNKIKPNGDKIRPDGSVEHPDGSVTKGHHKYDAGGKRMYNIGPVIPRLLQRAEGIPE